MECREVDCSWSRREGAGGKRRRQDSMWWEVCKWWSGPCELNGRLALLLGYLHFETKTSTLINYSLWSLLEVLKLRSLPLIVFPGVSDKD